MTNPLVTIISANYNNSKYVVETLESIAVQTYQNIELIVIDDFSKDDSPEKIEKWLKGYGRPHQFIRNPKNLGLCPVCNITCRAARGKYIAFLATDDVIPPDKIEKQVKFFESLPDNVGMIYSDASLIDEDGNKLFGSFIQGHRKFNQVPSGDIFEDLLEGNYIPGMTAMFKKSVLEDVGEFDETLFYEDYDMWLRIAKKYKVIFLDDILAKYRKSQASMTSSIPVEKWIAPTLAILAKHKDNPKVRERMDEILLEIYFAGIPYKEHFNKYGMQRRGLTYRAMKLGLPARITKSILALATNV